MSTIRNGGQGGIRTLERLLTVTHFPGVRLKPLGHLSGEPAKAIGSTGEGAKYPAFTANANQPFRVVESPPQSPRLSRTVPGRLSSPKPRRSPPAAPVCLRPQWP